MIECAYDPRDVLTVSKSLTPGRIQVTVHIHGQGSGAVILDVDGAVLLAQELAAFLRANVARTERLVDEESTPPIQTRTSSRRLPVLRHD